VTAPNAVDKRNVAAVLRRASDFTFASLAVDTHRIAQPVPHEQEVVYMAPV